MNLNLTFHVFGRCVVFLVQWYFSIIICYVVVMNNLSNTEFYLNEMMCVSVCEHVVFHLFLICEHFTTKSTF